MPWDSQSPALLDHVTTSTPRANWLTVVKEMNPLDTEMYSIYIQIQFIPKLGNVTVKIKHFPNFQDFFYGRCLNPWTSGSEKASRLSP